MTKQTNSVPYQYRPVLFFLLTYLFTWIFWIPAAFVPEDTGAVLMLAGLIALAGSRTIRGSLRYIGGALGAAALVLIAAAILYLCANILPMIREASESLAFMYRGAVSRLAVPAGILTAAMIAGSIVCLAMSRERDRNA